MLHKGEVAKQRRCDLEAQRPEFESDNCCDLTIGSYNEQDLKALNFLGLGGGLKFD